MLLPRSRPRRPPRPGTSVTQCTCAHDHKLFVVVVVTIVVAVFIVSVDMRPPPQPSPVTRVLAAVAVGSVRSPFACPSISSEKWRSLALRDKLRPLVTVIVITATRVGLSYIRDRPVLLPSLLLFCSSYICVQFSRRLLPSCANSKQGSSRCHTQRIRTCTPHGGFGCKRGWHPRVLGPDRKR